jgi:hypothetical protein
MSRSSMRRSTLPILTLAAATACGRPPSAPTGPTPEREAAPPSVAAVPANSRIRFRVAGSGSDVRYAQVARATTDTLWLASGEAMPVVRLTWLEASFGPQPSGRRLAWSAALGAGVGGVLGALVPPDPASQQRPRSRGQTAGLGALVGFLVGVGTWVVVSPSTQWTAVPLEPRP